TDRLWFTETGWFDRLGSIAPDGTIQEYQFAQGEKIDTLDITASSDKVWYTEPVKNAIGSFDISTS
ncbi:MAG TPA: hypothetical protein VN837_13895, partial [Chloroflexota bacterium]|nr:hypothetical protein [Chloroflexota bacterium]